MVRPLTVKICCPRTRPADSAGDPPIICVSRKSVFIGESANFEPKPNPTN
jgi:hypothetical protein